MCTKVFQHRPQGSLTDETQLDAVVVWDWLISLPREYRFVSTRAIVCLTLHEVLHAQIWKTHWTPVKVAYLFCRYVFNSSCDATCGADAYSYWVITVVPYLLYCFVVDHSLSTCRKIYKVRRACFLP